MAQLLDLSRNSDPTVRWLVTEQLMFLVQDHKLYNDAPVIISAIKERINDSEFKTRRLAVWAIGVLANYVDIPNDAMAEILMIAGKEEAVRDPKVVDTLGNPKTLRETAIGALVRIAKRHPDQVDRIRRTLEIINEPRYAEQIRHALSVLAEHEPSKINE